MNFIEIPIDIKWLIIKTLISINRYSGCCQWLSVMWLIVPPLTATNLVVTAWTVISLYWVICKLDQNGTEHMTWRKGRELQRLWHFACSCGGNSGTKSERESCGTISGCCTVKQRGAGIFRFVPGAWIKRLPFLCQVLLRVPRAASPASWNGVGNMTTYYSLIG